MESASLSSVISSTSEELPLTANLQPREVEEVNKIMKSRTEFYEQENLRMESVFQKLGLMNEQKEFPKEISSLVEKLSNLQRKFDVKELTPNAVALSYADMLHKHGQETTKLKRFISVYNQLNEALKEKVKLLKRYYKRMEDEIDSVSNGKDEVKKLELKIKLYESELAKYEAKYPMLRNEKYKVPYVMKEIEKLNCLKKENEQLENELSCYHGLKPDLQEASEQVAKIKKQYKELSKKLGSEY